MNEDPITKSQLKEILNDIITPRMDEIGLNKYDGRYLWFSDFNELGIKKVFHYNLMKGESGTFTYGNCFDFLSTYSSSGLIQNHKTDKSTKLHLFERTKGWRKSFEGERFTDKTSHWGEEECRKSVNLLLNKYHPIMKKWWSVNSTLEQNINTANYQIEKGGGYNVNHPKTIYCKAFLLAKTGSKEAAKQILEKEFKPLIEWKSKFGTLKSKLLTKIEEY